MIVDLNRLREAMWGEMDSDERIAVREEALDAVLDAPEAFYCRQHEEAFCKADYPPRYDHRCDGCVNDRCGPVRLVWVKGANDAT